MTEATKTNTQTRDSHESNSFSPRAAGGSVSISGSTIVNVILAVAALIAVAVAFQADQRSERAMDQARLMERQSKMMENDLNYIRAWLSARGFVVPANHEEAEE